MKSKDRLPADWANRRQTVLARAGGVCEKHHPAGRCIRPAQDVDHIRPGDNHDYTNLQALCLPCHQRKTAAEARARAAARYRPQEQHPGAKT